MKIRLMILAAITAAVLFACEPTQEILVGLTTSVKAYCVSRPTVRSRIRAAVANALSPNRIEIICAADLGSDAP